ncbi:hypothetical protein [Humisphaera borealis]|uniref:Uncharacterized protein n=1 Tax=Humisphaera borealis TaxID=2807512 RepID=A0A7M2WS20_9BACT|nr:hypothetical protein [Humisphaera borealis]QOV88308.1 hypothetical protein IPV69_18940 [Humisphaera borealis]
MYSQGLPVFIAKAGGVAPAWFVLPVFLLVAAVAIGTFFWQFGRSRRMLEDWAKANALQLVEARFRWFFRGPFFWTSSKGQTVYRICVRTFEGHTHAGWARCGGWFLGLLTDKVSVIWDNPAPNSTGGFPVIMRPPNQG